MARKRKWMVTLVIVGSATAFQFVNSCAQFGARGGLTALDFCSILNCQSGSFLSFCGDTPILLDCPQTTTTE